MPRAPACGAFYDPARAARLQLRRLRAFGFGLRALAEKVHSAHAGLGGERHKSGVRLGHFPGAQIELLLGQDHHRTAFGRFVRQRGQLRGIGQALRLDARRGNERGRHAVAQRDRAGLVEQQHVHVTRGLDRPAAGRHHVAADQRGQCR